MKLAQYQEQAYLLDPYLEKLVVPVAEALKDHARSFVDSPTKTYSSARVRRVALLLYSYVKFRGYKSIGASSVVINVISSISTKL